MAFLGGAECSTAGNPLTQFTKHVHNDNTLQRDRLVGRGPAGLEEGMRSRGVPNAPDQAMNEFLQQPGQIPATQPFEMDQIRRALPNFQQTPQRSGSSGWAAEFDPGEHARMEAAFQMPQFDGVKSNGFSPADFARFRQPKQNGIQRTSSPATQTPSYANGYQVPMRVGFMGAMNTDVGMGMPLSANLFANPQTQSQSTIISGPLRMVERDDSNWEAQFAALETDKQSAISNEAAAAMEAELNDMDRSVQASDDHFEAIWQNIKAESERNRDVLENFDFDRYMSNTDNRDLYDDFGNLPLPGDSLSRNAFPDGSYQFEEHNAFLTHPDPFSEGLDILRNKGNLSFAALAFEAAVQQSPEHATAWQLLGHTQAQNEKETPAIRALERAVDLDPANADALMSLAVSYTNESYDALAYRTLERWLSVKYPSIISPAEVSQQTDHIGFTDRANLQSRITSLFIRAAQIAPSGPTLDPDVQVGLGVLFYATEEHAKAVDCFNAALASTEEGSTTNARDVHLLWNRLGATLANSGRSEDAIAAYERALELNPNFVRARYNLGVSCINIGCYPEAAQHLLAALNSHRILATEGQETGSRVGMTEEEVERVLSVKSNESGNLYETLRRALGGMGRRDLVEKVGSGMSVGDMRGALGF